MKTNRNLLLALLAGISIGTVGALSIHAQQVLTPPCLPYTAGRRPAASMTEKQASRVRAVLRAKKESSHVFHRTRQPTRLLP